MRLAVAAEPTPISVASGGTARVGNTRARMASVLFLHSQGAPPEEIHESIPSVSLADVYAAIA